MGVFDLGLLRELCLPDVTDSYLVLLSRVALTYLSHLHSPNPSCDVLRISTTESKRDPYTTEIQELSRSDCWLRLSSDYSHVAVLRLNDSDQAIRTVAVLATWPHLPRPYPLFQLNSRSICCIRHRNLSQHETRDPTVTPYMQPT